MFLHFQVYQPMLKTCVLPGNVWDCQRGDGSTLSNDIQTEDIFGSALPSKSAFTTSNLTAPVLPSVASESTTIKPNENIFRPDPIKRQPIVEELFLANLRKKIAIQNAIASNQLAIHNALVGNRKALVASQSIPFTNINSPNIDRIGEQLHGLIPLVSRLKAIPAKPGATYGNPFPLKSPAQLPQFLAYPKVGLNLLPEQLKKITAQLVMQTATPPLFSTQKTNLNFLAPEPLRYTKHNVTKADSLPQNPNPHAAYLLSMYLSHQGYKVREDEAGAQLKNLTLTQSNQKENTTSSVMVKTKPSPNTVLQPPLHRKKPTGTGSIRKRGTKRPKPIAAATTQRPVNKKVTKRRKIKPKPHRKGSTATTTTPAAPVHYTPVKKITKPKRTRPHKKRITSTTTTTTTTTTRTVQPKRKTVTTTAKPETTLTTTTTTTTMAPTTTTPTTTTTAATATTSTTAATTTTSTTTPAPATTSSTTTSKGPVVSFQQITPLNSRPDDNAGFQFISIPSCRDGERFPNPNDCTRYYICSDMTPRKYVCPPFTAFNRGRRICDTTEYKRCVNPDHETSTLNYLKLQEIFTCETSGKFKDPTSRNHYYFCLQNTISPGWKRRRYQCPENYVFCDLSHICTLSTECN